MEIPKELIQYTGEINYNVISQILVDLKHLSDQLKFPVGLYKRILCVTDEALENVSKYYKTISENNDIINFKSPFYTLIERTDCYQIQIGSLIQVNSLSQFVERIDKINSYSKEQIKNLYKKTISDGVFSTQGGAGLGIIIIARSSENKINYTFESLTENWTYLTLKIEISK
jgi:hypothetical protein